MNELVTVMSVELPMWAVLVFVWAIGALLGIIVTWIRYR